MFSTNSATGVRALLKMASAFSAANRRGGSARRLIAPPVRFEHSAEALDVSDAAFTQEQHELNEAATATA
jgi:hypothetical protein